MREFSTPMMQQYMQIREQQPDCMLFFRLGDFYELFLEDALIGAKILGITLTRRPRGKDGDIPMAGVPFHSAETYINKLLKAGKKIAICEQVSEPDSKGIVERKIIRIITPGTIINDTALEQKKHNYLMSLSFSAEKIGLAAADVLTGDFLVCELDRNHYDSEQVGTEMIRFSPSESIVSLATYNDPELLHITTKYHQTSVTYFKDWEKVIKQAEKVLTEHFSIPSVGVFGLSQLKEATRAAATLISYLNHTQQSKVTHLHFPRLYTPQSSLLLDPATIANLEIFSTLQDQSNDGSLCSVLDMTRTAMGGRLLHSWLHHPLKEKTAIEERLDVVAELYQKQTERENYQLELESILDIERLASKLALGVGTAASLLNIKQSLQVFLKLHSQVTKLDSTLLQKWSELPVNEITEIVKDLEVTLIEKLDPNCEDSGVIKKGVNDELDMLREIHNSGKNWIVNFETQERQRTGINTLKCRYNQVFGFYIEVSHANAAAVPSDYQRKQTLVNAERFITPELKKQEELILGAEAKIDFIERQIFSELVARFLGHLEAIKITASALAQLDVFCSLAEVAQQGRYTRPNLNENGLIRITEGKHPVLTKKLKENFVPNDVLLNNAEHQLWIITGPNMAGKSVFMRQVALLVLMAHIGSFVPARTADISLVDQIFVRSGAADNISKGLSTFMVEMVEAAHILHQATSNSLVIMDEIGRGTSTYDGISIAWAIAEYLIKHENKKPKVLFATHYHELQALEEKYPKHISNYQVMVREHDGSPVFLYTLSKGAASHSFGIAVAKLAGVPEDILERATEMLSTLEATHTQKNSAPNQKKDDKGKLFIKEVSLLDVNNLTPIAALSLLSELQKNAKSVLSEIHENN